MLKTEHKMSDVILFEQISKRLGGREILRNVSFTVKQGDIFGYLGPNGEGKTTTIRILLWLSHADSGEAHIFGGNVRQDSIRRKIGFVLEADGLYKNLNAYENLDFYCRFYHMPKNQITGRIGEALHMVGLQRRGLIRL